MSKGHATPGIRDVRERNVGLHDAWFVRGVEIKAGAEIQMLREGSRSMKTRHCFYTEHSRMVMRTFFFKMNL